jgi:hypothetical protein
VDYLLDQMPGFIVGIVTGFITGIPTGLWVQRIIERRRRRDQVRQVTASITLNTVPVVPGDLSHVVRTGGYLTIKNNSEWPVTEVFVLEPRWLYAFHIPHLGPGRERVEPITEEVLSKNGHVEAPVTLQLTDTRGRVYQWRPDTDELFDTRWIPLHSRPIHWLDRRLHGRLFTPLLRRLPANVRDWLWGYDPSGDSPPKHRRMRPLV